MRNLTLIMLFAIQMAFGQTSPTISWRAGVLSVGVEDYTPVGPFGDHIETEITSSDCYLGNEIDIRPITSIFRQDIFPRGEFTRYTNSEVISLDMRSQYEFRIPGASNVYVSSGPNEFLDNDAMWSGHNNDYFGVRKQDCDALIESRFYFSTIQDCDNPLTPHALRRNDGTYRIIVPEGLNAVAYEITAVGGANTYIGTATGSSTVIRAPHPHLDYDIDFHNECGIETVRIGPHITPLDAAVGWALSRTQTYESQNGFLSNINYPGYFIKEAEAPEYGYNVYFYHVNSRVAKVNTIPLVNQYIEDEAIPSYSGMHAYDTLQAWLLDNSFTLDGGREGRVERDDDDNLTHFVAFESSHNRYVSRFTAGVLNGGRSIFTALNRRYGFSSSQHPPYVHLEYVKRRLAEHVDLNTIHGYHGQWPFRAFTLNTDNQNRLTWVSTHTDGQGVAGSIRYDTARDLDYFCILRYDTDDESTAVSFDTNDFSDAVAFAYSTYRVASGANGNEGAMVLSVAGRWNTLVTDGSYVQVGAGVYKTTRAVFSAPTTGNGNGITTIWVDTPIRLSINNNPNLQVAIITPK